MTSADPLIPGQWSWRLPPFAVSASAGRHLVHDVLIEQAVHESVLHDVELVVSELVTNALRHGIPPVDLHLSVSPRYIRVVVVDRGKAGITAVARLPSPDEESGRGLYIVTQLASDCGFAATPYGWESWAIIDSVIDSSAS